MGIQNLHEEQVILPGKGVVILEFVESVAGAALYLENRTSSTANITVSSGRSAVGAFSSPQVEVIVAKGSKEVLLPTSNEVDKFIKVESADVTVLIRALGRGEIRCIRT